MTKLTCLILLGVVSSFAQRVRADGANLFASSWSEGKRMDAERALPPTAFFEIPGPATGASGSLIRSEPASEYALPAGVTATRILYYSRTSAGETAISSGVVLVPYGTPPKGGWPVIAWSHGTSGVARACAPSQMRSLFYNWQGLYEYAMLGFAVVATDYAGLGTPGRHAYLDMRSNGSDVIYSVPAAREAVTSLSDKWVVVGHSQGGLSAIGAAEQEAEREDSGYLGAVSLAGASDLEDVIDAGLSANQPVLNGLLMFVVYGFQTAYPDLAVPDILTESAAKQYSVFVTDGCSAASGAFSELPANAVYRFDWKRNSWVQMMLERSRPGMRPARGPLLLVTGGADPMFTSEASLKIAGRLCRAGVRVQRSVYQGLGHDALVFGSMREQIEWIKSRFSGLSAPSNCKST